MQHQLSRLCLGKKRVFKNGKVWEKELFEIFYLDLDGKITSMTQFARDF